MNEIWSRWKEELRLPKKLVLDSLIDNIDGLILKFSDEDDEGLQVKVVFEDHVLSYRNRDEGEFLRKFKYLGDTYGDKFYSNWSFFQVKNSEYIQWFNEENFGIHQNEDIRHYVFITVNDVVEILSVYEPKIEIKR
ncbi:hypothetical protein [Caloranaerobacter sp. DY30410]|uniref:hypothetical protein n=1 Tax=Caloranaerobacter sp. DY30410 TaxID=3238305 RepID=UPI003D0903E0